MKKLLSVILFCGFIISGCGGTASVISTFEDCVKAGNPVMESYPRQCAIPEGKTFTEVITKPEPVDGVCKNECGNGECEEIVCMAIGCPCAETMETCPDDCK